MLGGVSWGRRVLTMRVRPDDAASWGHAWRRGNTGPSYKSKMWKNCKSRAASHMDESSLECLHRTPVGQCVRPAQFGANFR